MRLYSFLNYYLSPLQHGLQTAHCVSEMSLFTKETHKCKFSTWASNYKTIIICNGGNSASLGKLYEEFARLSTTLDIPFVKFNEDEQSLNGALTAVAVLVDEHYYDSVSELDSDNNPSYVFDSLERTKRYAYETPEYEFIRLLKSFQLA